MKTSELIGPALDWAVLVAQGTSEHSLAYWMEKYVDVDRRYLCEAPSSNWSQGGPIIEREGIEFTHNVIEPIIWCAWIKTWNTNYFKTKGMTGFTPLVAAMRAFVVSKLGDRVDIPEELL